MKIQSSLYAIQLKIVQKNLTLIEQKKNAQTLFLHDHWFIYIILPLITICHTFCFHNFIFNQLVSFFLVFVSFLLFVQFSNQCVCVRACSYFSGTIEFLLYIRLFSKIWMMNNTKQTTNHYVWMDRLNLKHNKNEKIHLVMDCWVARHSISPDEVSCRAAEKYVILKTNSTRLLFRLLLKPGLFFLNFIQLRIVNCAGEKENICHLTETKNL